MTENTIFNHWGVAAAHRYFHKGWVSEWHNHEGACRAVPVFPGSANYVCICLKILALTHRNTHTQADKLGQLLSESLNYIKGPIYKLRKKYKWLLYQKYALYIEEELEILQICTSQILNQLL